MTILPEHTPRRVLVTGGATNIGRAISESFLRTGARVAVAQKSTQAARELVKKHGNQVVALKFDQGRPADCWQLVEEAAHKLGGLDALVNNAAITGPGAGRAFLDLDDDFIDRVIDVNLKGVIRLSTAAGRIMREQGTGGIIVHITSSVAFRPVLQTSVYSATKAALTNLSQSMARELAVHGIRVLAVAPGDIWTDTFDQVRQERLASGVHEGAGRAVLGQGKPDDIGDIVAFMASPRANYVTGTTIIVDGGMLA